MANKDLTKEEIQKDTVYEIQVMQDFVDGKQIEFRQRNCKEDTEWTKCELPSWDWNNYIYRTSPEEVEKAIADAKRALLELKAEQYYTMTIKKSYE